MTGLSIYVVPLTIYVVSLTVQALVATVPSTMAQNIYISWFFRAVNLFIFR